MSDLLIRLYKLPDIRPCLERVEAQGFVIRVAMAYEKQDAVDWVRDTFGIGWAGETDVSFANRPISCYMATHEGRIVGFGCYDSTCRAFFGPTGVAEPFRGKGLGRALLLSCLHAMVSIGYAYAIVGGAGPTGFYTKVAGATEIPDSTPGIYRDVLKREKD